MRALSINDLGVALRWGGRIYRVQTENVGAVGE